MSKLSDNQIGDRLHKAREAIGDRGGRNRPRKYRAGRGASDAGAS